VRPFFIGLPHDVVVGLLQGPFISYRWLFYRGSFISRNDTTLLFSAEKGNIWLQLWAVMSNVGDFLSFL
jgi:hypothetical protein